MTKNLPALLLFLCSLALVSLSAVEVQLNTNDVVAFIGGGDVAAAGRTAHLESILAVRYPTVRFRNLGWEGDTVFEQPRDVGFPSLKQELLKAGSSVVFVQFGRMESLGGTNALEGFEVAYRDLIRDLSSITTRIVLVTPPPFEKPASPLLPNLQDKNGELALYVGAIRALGKTLRLPVIDLFAALSSSSERRTEDGLQLTPRGLGIVAQAFARQMGLDPAPAGDIAPAGSWGNPNYEQLRLLIAAKNRDWFNYWRPQNWAFLGGDRTEQPSSRDHRDPKIRWFPAEMERYPKLIAEKESAIARLGREINAK